MISRLCVALIRTKHVSFRLMAIERWPMVEISIANTDKLGIASLVKNGLDFFTPYA